MSSSSLSNKGDEVSGDVLVKIFLLLPADSLIRFRFVCKYWFNLITSSIHDPRFVQKHTRNLHQYLSEATTTLTTDNLPTIICTSINSYSINKNSSSTSSKYYTEAIEIVYPFKSPWSQLEILGSCIGLLCIRVFDKNDDVYCNRYRCDGKIAYTLDIICLWNPSTNEFKQVPAAPIEKPYEGNEVDDVKYGFGYDRLINDYKLVRLVWFDSDLESEVKVYTLGTNSWKRVDKKMPNSYEQLKMTGLFVNGALHWLRRDYLNKIFAFDIEDEEFREVPIPNCSDKMKCGARIQELRGCLCIFNPYGVPKVSRYEVWMMKDYGVKESWTMLFRVPYLETRISWYLKPLWICKNGEVLMGNGTEMMFPQHLVIYDPNENKVETIGYHGNPPPYKWANPIVHIGSLVSLKSGTYVGQEQQPKEEEEIENDENKIFIFRPLHFRSSRWLTRPMSTFLRTLSMLYCR